MLSGCHGNTIYTFLRLLILALPAAFPDPSPATAVPLSRRNVLRRDRGLHHPLPPLALWLPAPGCSPPSAIPSETPSVSGG